MADTWLIDGVVQYLRSPIWQMPVMGFIDQKCLVFDPEEENKRVCTELHKEYRQLVEFMLDSFVKDIGIKSEEFVNACKGHSYQSNASIMTLFEQVEAAQDFEVFKSMMIRQNIELELQALRVMEARHGIVPDIMQAGKDTSVKYSDSATDNEDDKILNEILRKSKEEFDALKRQGKEREAGINASLDKAITSSQKEEQRLQNEKKKEEEMLSKVLSESKDDFQRNVTYIEKEQAFLDKALNLSLSNNSPRSSSTSGLPPVAQSKKPSARPDSKASVASSTTSSQPATPAPAALPKAKAVSNAEAAANWLSSAKAEAATDEGRGSRASTTSSEASELKKREEYLKQQRDILIEKKRKEREKHFNKETESQSKAPARPKSARAARQATAGEVKVDSPSSAEQDKKMKMRLALADRLKKEVINEK